MKLTVLASVLICAASLAAQTVELVPNVVATQLLHGLIPEGQKMAKVTTFVANTSVNDVNLGMSCCLPHLGIQAELLMTTGIFRRRPTLQATQVVVSDTSITTQ